MTYYLDEYDIIKVCVYNGISNHYAFIRQPLNKQITILEDRLFTKLLAKNPKMKPFVDSFLKQYTEQYQATGGKPSTIEHIKNFWKDKITIEEFSEAILSSHYVFREDADRLKFLKSLFEKSPNFLKIVHKHIQSSIQNKNEVSIYTNISDSIYEAYFQMLKSKSASVIKKDLNINEIKENIDSFQPVKPNSVKKKINAYLSNFTKDSVLYNHVNKQLEEVISRNGTIKIFWEEKIALFTPDVIKQHNNEKTELPWGSSSSTYLYSFQLNAEFIVEKTHITQNQAIYFRGTFHNAIADFVSKNFNGELANLNGGTYYSVNIIFNDLDNKNRAEAFCETIKRNIENIVTAYCKKETNPNLSEQLNEHFKKLNLAFDLDKKLDQKQSTQKPIKNKI